MTLDSLQSRVVRCDDATYHGGSRRTENIDTVVWHTTEGHSAHEAREWDNRPNNPNPASYHYIIDRDGAIYRTVPVDIVAYHAGESAIPPCPPRPIERRFWINHQSIGVAFAGDLPEQPSLRTATQAQIESGYWLGVTLRELYPSIKNNYGHREVAPGRKFDPRGSFLEMPWWRWALAQNTLSYAELWTRYQGRHAS